MKRECIGGPLDGEYHEIPDKCPDNRWFEFDYECVSRPEPGVTRRLITVHNYRYNGHTCWLEHEGQS